MSNSKEKSNEAQRYNSKLERQVAAELRFSNQFEFVKRPGSRIVADEGSYARVTPDLVLRHDGQYIALDIAVRGARGVREVAVRRAVVAERLRQQLPDGSLVFLIIDGADIWQSHPSSFVPTEGQLTPELLSAEVRSSAGAALRKPGFDAVLFLDRGVQNAVVVMRDGRLLRYEKRSLTEAVERAVELRRWADDKELSSEKEAAINAEDIVPHSSLGTKRERYLLVADELSPAKGGISSFNLEFAKALRARDREVCIALPEAPSELDHQRAKDYGIRLALPANQIPGVQGPPAFLTGIRYLDQSDFRPTIIVGHGRILGPYAYALQMQHPSSSRIHLVHMHAEELERAKESYGGEPRTRTAAERSALEVELASSADVVAGVGKKLTGWIEDQVLADPLFSERGGQVSCLLPGLRDWPRSRSRVPTEKRFLITARADDFESKGIATAIRAVGEARTLRPNYPDTISLVIRGVPEEHTEVKRKVDELAAPYGFQPMLRQFSTNSDDIEHDLRTAVAVLMPSRTEGFGLSAYEAIAAEVPILITRDSGLARLIRDVDGTTAWPPETIPFDHEHSWVDAILKILDDPEANFRRARQLKDAIHRKDFWETSIVALEGALDESRAHRARTLP